MSRATLADQVEDAIRADISDGTFEAGRRLRSSELTNRYGVSATPLREALQRLAAEQLVELGPRLGATVAPLSMSELRDIYWVRELLESQALSRSFDRGDEHWVSGVRGAYLRLEQVTLAESAVEKPAVQAWLQAHREFHDSLFQACGSTWLRRFIAVLSAHSERYRLLSHSRNSRDSLGEHAAILAAVTGRHAESGVAALRYHLRETVKTIAREL